MSAGASIFINYRRADSAGWARQLHSDLAARFGSERVFRDVAIEPGVDFVEHIERVMDACEVCVAVIGPRWATVTTADGRRRLEDPADLVRLEIERALQRTDVVVIPVLVDGARMPGENELPEGLRPLARRHAWELTDAHWDYGVDVLYRRLRHVLGESSDDDDDTDDDPVAATALPIMATLGAAACAALVASVVSDPLAGQGETDAGKVVAFSIERGVLWAIVVAGVVATAAATFGRLRFPLGLALAGAGAGLLGGAIGGAGNRVLDLFASFEAADDEWLLVLVLFAPPAVALGLVVARAVGARAWECAFAAFAGAMVAPLIDLADEHRTIRLTLRVVVVVGAVVAVLATRPAAPSARAAPSRRAQPVPP